MKRRVLLVEDDALLAVVQERIIEHLGHQVLATASTGADAIAKFKKHQPDIIVMDIHLNGDKDGIETMQFIRQTSAVPVIYLSGSPMGDAQMKRVQRVDPIDFLMKPVDRHTLQSSFDKAFLQSKL